jgi:AAA15 family ATPase/GTPase
MLIHKIQIKNYKSFGDDDRNKLYLEPDVTTIIGKNESGKSNLLTGMAGISFFGDMSFMSNSENLNRSTLPGNEIEYEIILKPTESEKGLGLTDDTTINIKGKSQTVIGGLLSYYLHTVKPDIDVMLNEFGENPFKLGSSEYQTYNTYCINLKKDDVLFSLFSR